MKLNATIEIADADFYAAVQSVLQAMTPPTVVVPPPAPVSTPAHTRTRTANLCALAYGRTGGYVTADLNEIAQKFDVVISSPASIDMAALAALNPALVGLMYANISNYTVDDSLDTFAIANGFDPALRVTSASVQSTDAGAVNYAPGEAISDYSQSGRYQTDYTSDASRANLIKFALDFATKLGAFKGIMWDNMDRGGASASGELTSGSIALGNAPIGLSFGPQMEGALNALVADIDAQLPKALYLVNNISDYSFVVGNQPPIYQWQIPFESITGTTLSHPYAQGVVNARGTLQEFQYRFSMVRADFDVNYGGLKEIWTARGKPTNACYIAWWLRDGAGSIPADDDRVKLFALATHLLYQFDAMYLRYDGSNSNVAPLTGDWFGAMGVNLGAPLGEQAQDPTLGVFYRAYENGYVVVRFRSASSDDYTTSGVYPLPKPCFTVNADGTKSTMMASVVTLNNSEGFIGLYA